MQYDNTPPYLKDHQRFCLWRYETEKDGRKTKIFYNAKTHKRAQSNNLNTFTDYATAVKQVSKGVGIDIKVSSNIIAINLDRYVINRKLNSSAQKIVEKFPTSYVEISPSGEGLQIIILFSRKIIFNTALHYVKKCEKRQYRVLYL